MLSSSSTEKIVTPDRQIGREIRLTPPSYATAETETLVSRGTIPALRYRLDRTPGQRAPDAKRLRWRTARSIDECGRSALACWRRKSLAASIESSC